MMKAQSMCTTGGWRLAVGLAGVLLAGAVAAGQERPQGQTTAGDAPHFTNAHAEQRAAVAGLAADVKKWAEATNGPRWLGYAVPEVASDREVCCNNGGNSWNSGDCGICRLESKEYGVNMTSHGERSGNAGGIVKLEGPRNIFVLLRAENRHVMRIRLLSEDCLVDGGGLEVTWLTNVNPAESVAMLREFVRGEELQEHGHDERRVSDGALTAIALHADESADRALEAFVQAEQREELRKQAAFWLGEARGKAGLVALQKMAKNDPNADVRAHVTFALSVSRERGAVDEMIRMAKDDESGHVRGQALFWLAQKAGKKAVGSITEAIERDPDTEVKKKAVFALSQLPKDEGVPKLIEVAQNNHNPAVRKQAMFWLGQSNDPRALAFFEKVLSQ
jgi:hypothetical protein